MKKLTTILSLLFLLTAGMNNLKAQDPVYENEAPEIENTETQKDVEPEMETLIKKGTTIGGFGAFSTKITELNGQAAVLTGGQLAVVLDHSLNIGLVGYGLATDVNANYIDTEGNDYFFEMGYGGLLVEPVLQPNKLVHLSFPVLLGAGWAGVSDKRFFNSRFNYDRDVVESDVFWVIEPGVNVEVNIWKIAKVGFGLGYRYIGDADFTNTKDANMSGLSGNITFKIGWF